jgi:AraC-like DNA-binding protein
VAEVQLHYSFPDPQLFDLVAIYIEAEISGDGVVEDLGPPDMASIRMGLSGRWWDGTKYAALEARSPESYVYGPFNKAQWMRGEAGRGFIIGLNPLAWPVLIGGKAAALADQAAPLRSFWGDGAAELFDALNSCDSFEARVAAANGFLLARPRLIDDAELAQRIMAMRLALADPDCASVEEMTERVGISQPRLARLAKSTFGFTPKLLMRRERFRRMLHRADLMSYDNWREFIEAQYVDQSHLIRDFNGFLGMPPSRYLALKRPFVAAAFAEFRRLSGAA